MKLWLLAENYYNKLLAVCMKRQKEARAPTIFSYFHLGLSRESESMILLTLSSNMKTNYWLTKIQKRFSSEWPIFGSAKKSTLINTSLHTRNYAKYYKNIKFHQTLTLNQLLSTGKIVKWKSLSRVWLFVTPWTIQSMEFSRPEYRGG